MNNADEIAEYLGEDCHAGFNYIVDYWEIFDRGEKGLDSIKPYIILLDAMMQAGLNIRNQDHKAEFIDLVLHADKKLEIPDEFKECFARARELPEAISDGAVYPTVMYYNLEDDELCGNWKQILDEFRGAFRMVSEVFPYVQPEDVVFNIPSGTSCIDVRFKVKYEDLPNAVPNFRAWVEFSKEHDKAIRWKLLANDKIEAKFDKLLEAVLMVAYKEGRL